MPEFDRFGGAIVEAGGAWERDMGGIVFVHLPPVIAFDAEGAAVRARRRQRAYQPGWRQSRVLAAPGGCQICTGPAPGRAPSGEDGHARQTADAGARQLSRATWGEGLAGG